MPGILDFLTDVGADGELAGEFIGLISNPGCTKQELINFFNTKQYENVTEADAEKLLAQRESIKNDFQVPPHVDY